MVKRNRMDVDAFFSEVDQTREVYSLRERIKTLEEKLDQTVNREQELVAEIDQLRLRPIDEHESQQLQNQIDTLREHLKENQGTIQYPVNKITPNPNQPRKTFTEEVEAMMLSLQREGQLDPVILFEGGMLFDGECRYRAAQILGWENLEAVFTSKIEEARTLRRKAYLTSLHRHGLNALDKAETIVALTCDEIPELFPEEVPRIVNRVLTRLKRKRQSLGEKLHLQLQEQQQIVLAQLELEPVETQVLALLLGLQEHPASLNRNIFPSLNLTLDLKDAVREQALGCAQALILNRISAKELGISEKSALKLRAQGIQKVIAENLSTAATQQWVAQQKAQFFKPSMSLPIRDKKIERILTIAQDIDLGSTIASIEQRQELKQVLETLLQQLQ